MKNHQKKKFTIGIFCLSCVLLMIIPIYVAADTITVADGMPINPYPDKIYGEEFRSAASPYGCAYGFKYTDPTNSSLNTDWEFTFFLSEAQMAQLTEWEQYRCNMTVYEAFSTLVPDQMAALPKELQQYLKNRSYMWISHAVPPLWSNPGCGDVWKDPSGTTVPLQYVPWAIKDGITYTGVRLYVDETRYEYTDEVKTHLANLGLATGYDAADLSVSTSIPGGQYTITFEGNTPSGVRKSWTFVLDNSGTWHDSTTGEVMDIDAQYVLAALRYVNPPGQSYSVPSTVTTTIKFTATGLTRNTVQSLTPGVSAVSSRFGNTLSPLTQGSATVKIPAYSMNPILSSSLNLSPATVSFPSDVFPASQIKNSNKVNSSQRSIVLLKTYTKNFTYA